MNRNQKIALGCGGAGCLGLIVVAIAGCLIYFFAYRSTPGRSYNYNVSTNRNSNLNGNSGATNGNANDNSSNSNSSSSSSTSSMSEDEKHRLYHAAGMTGDTELVRRVSIKIGLTNEDFTPGANVQKFIEEHASWSVRDTDFINSLDTAEKARAYINAHIDD
ncbi:MAG TPA: hypothetical protein VGC73_10415 [Pyrinomonadaceae bacterium]|jgi:hypothetical protein